MGQLFNKQHLSEILNTKMYDCKNYINKISRETILSSNLSKIIEELEKKFILNVPVLDEVEISNSEPEDTIIEINNNFDDSYNPRNIDRYKGTLIKFFVPFNGNKELFNYCPSHYELILPQADISGNEIIISYRSINIEKAFVHSSIKGSITTIKRWLEWVKIDVDKFNSDIKILIKETLEAKYEKSVTDKNIVESLGFPLKVRNDAKITFQIPSDREKQIKSFIFLDKTGKIQINGISPYQLHCALYDYYLEIERMNNKGIEKGIDINHLIIKIHSLRKFEDDLILDDMLRTNFGKIQKHRLFKIQDKIKDEKEDKAITLKIITFLKKTI
ncbi:MAG: hypothetical protein ABSG15_10400 [FCB group bacterium]|jgi:hypothetical protein